MNEIAVLLGIELDEEFIIEDYGTYVLTWKGLMRKDGAVQGLILTLLLTGELKIRRKPWKPIKYGAYYYVAEDGLTWEEEWINNDVDRMRYKLGNCYRTIKEAEANINKWSAFYASDKQIEI
jgi:hypothetical protein